MLVRKGTKVYFESLELNLTSLVNSGMVHTRQLKWGTSDRAPGKKYSSSCITDFLRIYLGARERDLWMPKIDDLLSTYLSTFLYLG